MWKLGQIRRLYEHLEQAGLLPLTPEVLKRWYGEQGVDPYPKVRDSRLQGYISIVSSLNWQMKEMSRRQRKRSLTPISSASPSVQKVRKLKKENKSPHDVNRSRRPSIDRACKNKTFEKPKPRMRTRGQDKVRTFLFFWGKFYDQILRIW